MARVPRLRMFAGPNGSGKSTLKSLLSHDWIGSYINPDELELTLRTSGVLDFEKFEVSISASELQTFFESSPLLKTSGHLCRTRLEKSKFSLIGTTANSYHASVLSDFLRRKLLAAGKTMTFETVMSSADKLDFLAQAKNCGYRNYLYFVATEGPEINVARVKARVGLGGHAVPEDKIVQRYYRSLGLLKAAIKLTERAYIFDNSADNSPSTWIAEVSGGTSIELKTNEVPAWFARCVLS